SSDLLRDPCEQAGGESPPNRGIPSLLPWRLWGRPWQSDWLDAVDSYLDASPQGRWFLDVSDHAGAEHARGDGRGVEETMRKWIVPLVLFLGMTPIGTLAAPAHAAFP